MQRAKGRTVDAANKKPEEIIMLSKLKAIIAKANKTAVILAVMLVLSGISLNSYIYDDTIQVHINVDGVTVKTVNTKSGHRRRYFGKRKHLAGAGRRG